MEFDDLRCDSKKHGVVIDDHTIEIKCSSRFCGAVPAQIVVIHRFDLVNPGHPTTRKYKIPNKE